MIMIINMVKENEDSNKTITHVIKLLLLESGKLKILQIQLNILPKVLI
jgi:hypothetical protein